MNVYVNIDTEFRIMDHRKIFAQNIECIYAFTKVGEINFFISYIAQHISYMYY